MKSGDIVRLKSGGPKMTVLDVSEFMQCPGRRMALCTWFENNDKKQESLFEPNQLELVITDEEEVAV